MKNPLSKSIQKLNNKINIIIVKFNHIILQQCGLYWLINVNCL